MEEKERNRAYEKLTPQRKQIVDEVIKNLESGVGLWQPGWSMPGVPESAIGQKISWCKQLPFELCIVAKTVFRPPMGNVQSDERKELDVQNGRRR